MDGLVGQRIGNFTLSRLVGEGTMGGVFLAQHDRIDRPKAVKVLRPQWSRDAEQVRRFFAEARAAGACSSDHIVAVDDCGTLVASDGEARHYILVSHYAS